MNIKVMGAGCARCKTLEHNIREAIKELNLDVEPEIIKDFQKMTEYGVMRTPALVIDEKLVSSGRVPELTEIKDLLMNRI